MIFSVDGLMQKLHSTLWSIIFMQPNYGLSLYMHVGNFEFSIQMRLCIYLKEFVTNSWVGIMQVDIISSFSYCVGELPYEITEMLKERGVAYRSRDRRIQH